MASSFLNQSYMEPCYCRFRYKQKIIGTSQSNFYFKAVIIEFNDCIVLTDSSPTISCTEICSTLFNYLIPNSSCDLRIQTPLGEVLMVVWGMCGMLVI